MIPTTEVVTSIADSTSDIQKLRQEEALPMVRVVEEHYKAIKNDTFFESLKLSETVKKLSELESHSRQILIYHIAQLQQDNPKKAAEIYAELKKIFGIEFFNLPKDCETGSQTALHFAAYGNKDIKVFKILLNLGCYDINQSNSRREPPLIDAIEAASEKAVAALIELGANIHSMEQSKTLDSDYDCYKHPLSCFLTRIPSMGDEKFMGILDRLIQAGSNPNILYRGIPFFIQAMGLTDERLEQDLEVGLQADGSIKPPNTQAMLLLRIRNDSEYSFKMKIAKRMFSSPKLDLSSKVDFSKRIDSFTHIQWTAADYVANHTQASKRAKKLLEKTLQDLYLKSISSIEKEILETPAVNGTTQVFPRVLARLTSQYVGDDGQFEKYSTTKAGMTFIYNAIQNTYAEKAEKQEKSLSKDSEMQAMIVSDSVEGTLKLSSSLG